MAEFVQTRTRLRRGQALRLYADAGLIVVAASGRAGILHAGSTIPVTKLLHEGEAERIECAQWITITAYEDAVIICTADPPRRASAWQRLRALLPLRVPRFAGKKA